MTITAQAQDFQQLLNAVDKIEANLKMLVEKEAATRAAEIAKLRTEVGAQPGASTTNENSPWVIQLRQELDSLRIEVAKLATASKQLASADEQGVTATVPSSTQVEALTAGLTSLNDRLEKYVNTEATDPKDAAPSHETSATAKPVAGLEVFGFVAASAVDDRNASRSTFGVDEMELDVQHDFAEKATVRADIEYKGDAAGKFNMDLEQGYVLYNIGSNQKWTFSFGKFNAPFGFEAVDAPDRYQYSYAAVSKYAVPGNLTGAMLHTQFTKVIGATAFFVNGWDVSADNNSGKTWGTHWEFTPRDNMYAGLAAITGPEQDNRTDSRRSVLDLCLNYDVTPSLMFGGEANYGMESKILDNGSDARWFGFLLMSYVGLSEDLHLAMRLDYLKDYDGYSERL